MTFYLLDECVAKCCVNGGTTYTAQRSVEVDVLGYSAPDADIYNYALRCSCVLVTLNGYDFVQLATKGWPTAQVIVLPEVRPRIQHTYLKWVAPLANVTFANSPGRFVEVSVSGKAISYQVGQNFNSTQSTANQSAQLGQTLH